MKQGLQPVIKQYWEQTTKSSLVRGQVVNI